MRPYSRDRLARGRGGHWPCVVDEHIGPWAWASPAGGVTINLSPADWARWHVAERSTVRACRDAREAIRKGL